MKIKRRSRMFFGMLIIALGAVVVFCGVTLLPKDKPDERSFKYIELNGFTIAAQPYENNPDEVIVTIMNKDKTGKAMTFNRALDLIAATPGIIQFGVVDKEN
jgi:hypothetical protein